MSDTAQPGYAALVAQAAKGTPGTVLTRGMKCTDVGLSGRSDTDFGDAEIGGGRYTDANLPMLAGHAVSGGLSGYLRSTTFPLLLLGTGFTFAAPTQDGVTGAYTHVGTLGSTLTWLTAETSYGAGRAVRRFSDLLVGELNATLDANARAMFEANLVGITEAWQGGTSAVTYDTDPVADTNGSAITLDTLGTYKWESVGVHIANSVSDDEHVVGVRSLDDVTPGAREVTMTGTIKVGANTPSVTDLYRAAVYGSKTATAPGLDGPYHTSGNVVLGHRKFAGTSTTVRYGHTVAFADLVISGFPLEASGDDRLAVEIECRAVGNPECTWTVRNAQATQYV